MAAKWRLGVVLSPEPGHEPFQFRLSIPYQNKLGVIALKFRCMQGHDHKDKEVRCAKYLGLSGQDTYLFNVAAVDTPGQVIHLTEGETDAMVISEVFGDPVVGIPGSDAWQPHWPAHFHSFERVIAWPDGDRAGQTFAAKLRKEISAVEIVQMPRGKDVNEIYLESGPDALKELAGVDDSSTLEVAHV